MTSQWQPVKEPLRVTVARAVAIAVVVSGAIALVSRKWFVFPQLTVLVLWPSFGGHWVELWFLNWLRPRISPGPIVQLTIRVLVWFAGGSLLALGMRLMAAFFQWRSPQWLTWWLGGAAFIGIELVMHLFLQFRGQPSFYNGRR